MNRLLEALKKHHRGYDKMVVSKLRLLVQPLINTLSDTPVAKKIICLNVLAQAHGMCAWYFARLRDFNYFAPRFKETLSLQGPRLVIVGRDHLSVLEKTYKGEPIEAPPRWEELEPQIPEPYLGDFRFARAIIEGRVS